MIHSPFRTTLNSSLLRSWYLDLDSFKFRHINNKSRFYSYIKCKKQGSSFCKIANVTVAWTQLPACRPMLKLQSLEYSPKDSLFVTLLHSGNRSAGLIQASIALIDMGFDQLLSDWIIFLKSFVWYGRPTALPWQWVKCCITINASFQWLPSALRVESRVRCTELVYSGSFLMICLVFV